MRDRELTRYLYRGGIEVESSGKAALVTGAGSGLGRATALQLIGDAGAGLIQHLLWRRV